MREYSVRFLIAMIIGICVLLLFMTGKSDQTAIAEISYIAHIVEE